MTALPASSVWREADGAIPNALAIGYAVSGYIAGFVAMAAQPVWLNALGVLLSAHAMMIAAYLIHEAAHYTLFARQATNRAIGELMNFIAGGAYASFDRIRHLHLRHHRDRADVTCFDYKRFLRARPRLQRLVCALEWAYVPAVEIIMHLQVILRPMFEASQRRHLPRVLAMLVLRGTLLAMVAIWSLKALLLYFVAYWLLLSVLNFFDAFHHTFEQYFTDADAAVPMDGRDRAYEQANTYSNVVSARWPVANPLTLNFGYHNAHHERAAVPWYRLPQLQAELYGAQSRELMPLSELLRAYHRHRVRRAIDDDYGYVEAAGSRRADHYVGAHGVSFLTLV